MTGDSVRRRLLLSKVDLKFGDDTTTSADTRLAGLFLVLFLLVLGLADSALQAQL